MDRAVPARYLRSASAAENEQFVQYYSDLSLTGRCRPIPVLSTRGVGEKHRRKRCVRRSPRPTISGGNDVSLKEIREWWDHLFFCG